MLHAAAPGHQLWASLASHVVAAQNETHRCAHIIINAGETKRSNARPAPVVARCAAMPHQPCCSVASHGAMLPWRPSVSLAAALSNTSSHSQGAHVDCQPTAATLLLVTGKTRPWWVRSCFSASEAASNLRPALHHRRGALRTCSSIHRVHNRPCMQYHGRQATQLPTACSSPEH